MQDAAHDVRKPIDFLVHTPLATMRDTKQAYQHPWFRIGDSYAHPIVPRSHMVMFRTDTLAEGAAPRFVQHQRSAGGIIAFWQKTGPASLQSHVPAVLLTVPLGTAAHGLGNTVCRPILMFAVPRLPVYLGLLQHGPN